jgi:hypothetical protein
MLRPTLKTSLSAAVADALLERLGEQNGAAATEIALLFEAAREERERPVQIFRPLPLAARHLACTAGLT